MKYFFSLYITCFSIALLLGRLCYLFNLHWFMVVILAGIFLATWCWWNSTFGTLSPKNSNEAITKFIVVPVAVVGWVIGRIYGIG